MMDNLLNRHYIEIGRKWVERFFGELKHYGTEGMQWGVRNGPPYPLERNYGRLSSWSKPIKGRVFYKSTEMPIKEYNRASELWKRIKELPLSRSEKEAVYENFDNNLTTEEKKCAVVNDEYKDHEYVAINRGHNDYKIIKKIPIDEVNIHEANNYLDELDI